MTFNKNDIVYGTVGVFYTDRAAAGTVVGTRQARESGKQVTLVGVLLPGLTMPVWVPADALSIIAPEKK